MMNSLSAGFYLPVYVTEDCSKKLFFLSPDHEASIKTAFDQFDELKKLPPLSKVNYFMTSKDIQIKPQGSKEIRALRSSPRDDNHFINQETYDQWLSDKVILRTERFFSGRPAWNVASTRHALLGDYQFKGIGLTGTTGRCDYPHIHGNLDIYLALFETVMSWHFKNTPIKSQKVVALWKDDHRTNPMILMLREASSFRLAQIMGIDLESDEKEIIFRSLQITNHGELKAKFFNVLKNYAWFVAQSYEYTSPSTDNLMLDGSLIDCSSIFHHNGNGWSVPFHLTKDKDGLWRVRYTFCDQILALIFYTHKTYLKLGLELDIEAAVEYFWNELTILVGESAAMVRAFFRMHHPNWKKRTLNEWQQFLQSSFSKAEITSAHPEVSRFYQGPDDGAHNISFKITFGDGPQKDFSSYGVTDRIFQFMNANRDISPMQFAEAVIRSAK